MADITQTSQVLPAQGFAGAIPKQAPVEPARAFLEFLTSPSSKECFKSFGLE